MSKYHCIRQEGRLILGKFYRYGDTLDLGEEHSALAFSMMEAGILERGSFLGKKEYAERPETVEKDDSEEKFRKTEEEEPKKSVRKKV